MLSRSLFGVLTLVALPLHAQVGPVPVKWTSFTFTSQAGDTVAADSARIVVPERRDRAGGSPISLAVVRVRSTSATPGLPVVYLAGGPGGAGIAGVRGDLFPMIKTLRNRGDVILFDQRGTGATLPSLVVRTTFGVPLGISAGSPEALAALVARAKAAADEMRSKGIDLTAYNTQENASDVDDIRRALGLDKWIVWGHSYGSHLGLAYVRQYGAHVERTILGGVNGPDHRRRFPSDGDALLRGIDSALKAAPALRAIMPDFLGSTRRVLDGLATKPVTVRIDSQEVLVGRDEVQAVIAIQSGDAGFVRRLPWLVGRMEAGDFTFMGRLARDVIKNRPLGTTMTYAMDLASGVSAPRAQRIRREAPTALLGNAINFPFDNPDFQAAWNVPDLGPAFRADVRSSVPALFISGTLDGRTSIADAEAVRKGFAGSAHIVLQGASHNPYAMHAGLHDLITRFLAGEKVASTTLKVANVEWRMPDETALVEELRLLATRDGAAAAANRLRELGAPGSKNAVTSFVVTGVLQALGTSNRDASAALIEAGAQLLPWSTTLLTRLGELELARGNRDAAVSAFKRALAADPFNQSAGLQLAKLGAAP
jgi:pimeloyl-ACP methyl ester carboxylesterase